MRFDFKTKPMAFEKAIEKMKKEEPASVAFIDVFQRMEEKHLEYFSVDGYAYSMYIDEDGVEFSVEK